MINISDINDSELWTRAITPDERNREPETESQLTGIERRLGVSSSDRTPASRLYWQHEKYDVVSCSTTDP